MRSAAVELHPRFLFPVDVWGLDGILRYMQSSTLCEEMDLVIGVRGLSQKRSELVISG